MLMFAQYVVSLLVYLASAVYVQMSCGGKKNKSQSQSVSSNQRSTIVAPNAPKSMAVVPPATPAQAAPSASAPPPSPPPPAAPADKAKSVAAPPKAGTPGKEGEDDGHYEELAVPQ